MSITPPPPPFDPSVQQQQQSPPVAMAAEQAYSARTGNGSVGPVIAVLAVITILCAIAVMIGRICSSRGIFGHEPRYDLESWVETKCSSCVDGRVDLLGPWIVVVERSNSGRSEVALPPLAAATSVEIPDQDTNEEDEEETISDQTNHRSHSHNDPVHPLEPSKS